MFVKVPPNKTILGFHGLPKAPQVCSLGLCEVTVPTGVGLGLLADEGT